MATLQMNRLKKGSKVTVRVNKGELKHGVISRNPPIQQSSRVWVKFQDWEEEVQLVIVDPILTTKLGILSAQEETLIALDQLQERRIKHYTASGIELSVGTVVVAPWPLNPNELFAVKITKFHPQRTCSATYCSAPPSWDLFSIDSFVRILDSQVNPVMFKEFVDQEHGSVVQEEVGDFVKKKVYKVARTNKGYYNVLVLTYEESEKKEYLVVECRVSDLERTSLPWRVSGNTIKNK